MNLNQKIGGFVSLVPDEGVHTQIDTENPLKRIKFNNSKTLVRMTLAILILGGILGPIEGATSRMAHAAASDVVVHHIINGSWYLHPGNSTDTPSFSGPLSDLMTQGTEFDVQCVTSGPPITPDGTLAADGSGDVAWEYGSDMATGNMGFISDQGLDTQVTLGNEIAQLETQGIPACGSQSTGNSQSNSANPEYDRMAAVNWALAHAQDPQTHDEECAYFVSQALWAGGLPQTANMWSSQGGTAPLTGERRGRA